MPDNILINQGTSTAVSTEEVTNLNGAGVPAQHVQRVIPAVRTGEATAQDVTSANPMPVGVQGTATVLVSDSTPVQTRSVYSNVLRVVIPASTTAYSIGDVVGGQLTVVNAARFTSWGLLIENINMFCDDALSPNLKVMFFQQSLTGGTYTDNAAMVLSSSDKGAWVANAEIPSGSWETLVSDAWVTVPTNIRIRPNATQDIRILIVAKSIFTLTASTNLRISLGAVQD